MIGPHILLVASTTAQSQQVSAKDSGTLCQHLQSPKVVCEPQIVFIKEIECPGKSNDLDSGTLGSSSGPAPQTSVYLIRKTGRAQATGIELSAIETVTSYSFEEFFRRRTRDVFSKDAKAGMHQLLN